MTAPQALLTAHTFAGLGLETTRNTPVVPTWYLPIDPPDAHPVVTWLQDDGLRGSASHIYGNQAGVRHDEYDAKGKVFADSFPILFRNILGSTDTVVTPPGSTTLSATATAPTATISVAASIPALSAVIVGANGPTPETHITLSVTGAGPYTVTLVTPLVNTQTSGLSVTGLTSHTIGQLNSVAVGSQPPSTTITDFTSGEAGTTTARNYSGAMLSDLSLMFASTAPLNFTAKWLTLASGTVTAPTSSFTPELFIPAWSCAVYLAGVGSSVVADGQIDIKRSTQAIHTLGSQSPFQIWDAPLDVSGKLTFVLQVGDTTMQNASIRNAQSMILAFNDPFSRHLVELDMSQIQLKDPKIVRTKSFLEVETNFDSEANTGDAVSGGYSPIKARIANAVTAAY